MRHRTKFREDGQTVPEIWQIFDFFKMAAAAILDFGKFKFLTIQTLNRFELRPRAKFCRYRSKRG